MTNGLKVYYVPMTPFVQDTCFPTFSVFFPLFRYILVREEVDIVHGHQVRHCLETQFVHRTFLLLAGWWRHACVCVDCSPLQGLRTFPNSFYGWELVDWLVKSGACLNREAAVELGSILLEVSTRPLVCSWLHQRCRVGAVMSGR